MGDTSKLEAPPSVPRVEGVEGREAPGVTQVPPAEEEGVGTEGEGLGRAAVGSTPGSVPEWDAGPTPRPEGVEGTAPGSGPGVLVAEGRRTAAGVRGTTDDGVESPAAPGSVLGVVPVRGVASVLGDGADLVGGSAPGSVPGVAAARAEGVLSTPSIAVGVAAGLNWRTVGPRVVGVSWTQEGEGDGGLEAEAGSTDDPRLRAFSTRTSRSRDCRSTREADADRGGSALTELRGMGLSLPREALPCTHSERTGPGEAESAEPVPKLGRFRGVSAKKADVASGSGLLKGLTIGGAFAG